MIAASNALECSRPVAWHISPSLWYVVINRRHTARGWIRDCEGADGHRCGSIYRIYDVVSRIISPARRHLQRHDHARIHFGCHEVSLCRAPTGQCQLNVRRRKTKPNFLHPGDSRWRTNNVILCGVLHICWSSSTLVPASLWVRNCKQLDCRTAWRQSCDVGGAKFWLIADGFLESFHLAPWSFDYPHVEMFALSLRWKRTSGLWQDQQNWRALSPSNEFLRFWR